MMKFVRGVSVIRVVMLLALCGAMGCSFSSDRKEAEQLAEEYFAKMKGGDIEGVLPFYSAGFYEETSPTEWRTILEDQRARCGVPQSYSLVNWNVFSSFGSNSGTRTTLIYAVRYSRCRVRETLTTFKPSGGNIQIQRHVLKRDTEGPGEGDSQSPMKT
jgi:hypothetical protein